ncbi:MAG: polyphenol oxidase family protein [Microgenomates group bacterium]
MVYPARVEIRNLVEIRGGSDIGVFPILNQKPVVAGFSWGNNARNMVEPHNTCANTNEFLKELGTSIPPRVVLKSVEYNDEKVLVVTKNNYDVLACRANHYGIQTGADVLVTDIPNLTLLVKPADCTVAVLYGSTSDGKDVLGVAHAGWRETMAGVPATIVQQMAEMGCDPDTMSIAIAPSIMMKNFWVRPQDLSDDQRKKWKARAKDDIVERDGEVVMLDVLGRVIDIMLGEGVNPSNVMAYAVDTFTAAQDRVAFSHRLSTVTGDKSYDGRFAVAAALRGKCISN